MRTLALCLPCSARGAARASVLLSGWLAVACGEPSVAASVTPVPNNACATDGECPGGWICDAGDCTPGCVGDAACGVDQVCRGFHCLPSTCGNGTTEEGEDCDDGENNGEDRACTSACRLNVCGDRRIETGVELCDDGNLAPGDGCNPDCTLPRCGDGLRQLGETCDDANSVDGDGCDNNCRSTACGNGALTTGETCDDGNRIDGDGCDHDCTLTGCGNGIRTGTEECDDGNDDDTDACLSTCAPPFCIGGADDDSDGVPDRCDACPGIDDRGSEGDADFDRLCAAADNCATRFNPAQEDTNGDERGDACGMLRETPSVWLSQAEAGDTPEASDIFGSALAAADLNNDGTSELIVGAYGENGFAGAVSIFWGGPSGLGEGETFVAADFGVVGTSSAFLGIALATGDLDNDAYNDVIISAPNQGTAGLLFVLWGGPSGVTPEPSGWDSPTLGCGTSVAPDDFGWALAAGDLGNDGRDDLVIGAPGRTSNAGIICMVRFDGRAPDTGAVVYNQGSVGVPAAVEGGDRFGASLALGYHDADRLLDLVIGVPGEMIGGAGTNEGAISLLHGTSGGITFANGTAFNQDNLGGVAEPTDRFGHKVALADLDGNGIGDVIASAPGEDDVLTDYGVVVVIRDGNAANRTWFSYGNVSGLAAANGDNVGDSLLVIDADGDGLDDLLVGASGRTVNSATGAGGVLGLKGGATAPEPFSVATFGHTPTASNYWGATLASGDFDGDGVLDIAIGAPMANRGVAAGGAVLIVRSVVGSDH